MAFKYNAIIFCDTCLFFSSPKLEDELWKKLYLISTNKCFDAELLITKPLKKEIKKKLNDLHNTEYSKILKEAEKLKVVTLTEEIEEAFNQSKTEFIDGYFTKYVDKIFPNKVKYTESFPEIKPEEIFDILVNEKKPFKVQAIEGGYKKVSEGFRDLIIWHSLEEYLDGVDTEKTKVFFCSNNFSDFSKSKKDKNILHSDFEERLEKISFPRENFHYVTNHKQVNEFLKEIEIDNTNINQQIIQELESIHLNDTKLENIILTDEYIFDVLPTDAVHSINLDQPRIEKATVNEVYSEGTGTYVVEGDVEIAYSIEFFTNKYEIACSIEEQKHAPEEKVNKLSWEVSDGNWNDYHSLCVTEETSTLFHFLSTINIEDQSVDVVDFLTDGQDIQK